MGYGGYSTQARSIRADSLGYQTKSADEIFSNEILEAMNPKGVEIRESRDSDEHPESLSILLGLDVTGSMGTIPHYLVREGLPNIMQNIMDGGCLHPQILFLAIGDHYSDRAPLQISQFESSDPLLDHWLTSVWLEGNGGGNGGESYLLAWYFAAFHTSIDCFEKRNQKGFLFTVGDEPVHKKIERNRLNRIMGPGREVGYTAFELLEKAREMYNVYHLHLTQGYQGRKQSVMDGWKELMGDNLLIINRKEEVSHMISKTILLNHQPEFLNSDDMKIRDDDKPIGGGNEPEDETEIIL